MLAALAASRHLAYDALCFVSTADVPHLLGRGIKKNYWCLNPISAALPIGKNMEAKARASRNALRFTCKAWFKFQISTKIEMT